jgi:ABC-type phosphate transport system substrate-binding protein
MRNAVILTLGLGALASVGVVGAAEKETYKVIVNVANPETTVSTERLSTLFLKNVGKWPNGVPVLPVDQSTTAPVRIAFSKDVFDQAVMAIQSYWQDQIRQGLEGPPPGKASDRDVVAYVEANAGAIGYVSLETVLPARTKALKVTR